MRCSEMRAVVLYKEFLAAKKLVSVRKEISARCGGILSALRYDVSKDKVWRNSGCEAGCLRIEALFGNVALDGDWRRNAGLPYVPACYLGTMILGQSQFRVDPIVRDYEIYVLAGLEHRIRETPVCSDK
jgi:hypothetical protein